MIQLAVLGTIGLRQEDGREITAVLQQPKRLAVLTYLVGYGRGHWHRRDSLLGTFWPEMTDERARAALRRTLTFLRTHLGDPIIRTRGDEVAVDHEQLWCDLVACDDALRAGQRAEAAALYRGEPLAGLHVPSAPEFERWLDRTRARLHRGLGDALASLAREAEEAGQLAQAAAWRRRALELAPDDEAELRRLLDLLDRLGDRTGAVRAYEDFAERLAADLDLTPDAETSALVEQIRAREVPVATAAAPLRELSADVIAVFPFTVLGPPDVHYLREGLVDLLNTKLDGAGDLRTVDPGSVLARTHLLGSGPHDPGAARVVAAELGAGSFLLGSVVADGERTLLRATLHATRGNGEVRVDTEGTAATGIFELVDDLVRQLLATRTQSLGGQLTRLGALTTDSLPALRAYLDGERALRLGRAHESRAAYARATDLDPAFALPHYRLAIAHAACGAPVAALGAVDRAVQQSRHLSLHTRTLLAAQNAYLQGTLAKAERLCLRLLADRPDDVEAWYRLARVYLDGNRFRGRPEAEARTALERTCALDPRHAAALADLARLAWTTGDHVAARLHANHYLELSTDGDDAAVMAVLSESGDALARLAGARPAAFHQVVALQMLGFDLPGAIPPATAGPWASVLAAHAAAAAGQSVEARAALARAAQLDPELALDHEGFLATLPGCRAVAATGLEDRLRERATEGAAVSGTTPVTSLRPALALHTLGMLAEGPGTEGDVAATVRACASVSVPPWALTLPAALAAGIEAHQSAGRGDLEAAVDRIVGIELGPWIHLASEIPECGLVAERILLVRALTALGRPDDAATWRTPPAMLRPLEWAVAASFDQ